MTQAAHFQEQIHTPKPAPTKGDLSRHASSSDAPIEKIISALHGLRKTGAGRWLARCPSHEDRSPSLSIRELDDGRVLMHCFAGCSVSDVVSAIGLEMHDLFPSKLEGGQHINKSVARPFNAVDILRAINFEVKIVLLAAKRVSSGVPLSKTDYERLLLACTRVESGLEAGRLI